MPDTARAVTYFTDPSTGVFKDNSSKAITAQQLRDFVVSVLGEYGHLYKAGAATGFATNTSGVKMSTLDTAGVSGGNVAVTAASNRIVIGTTGTYHVSFTCYLQNASSAGTFGVYLYRNGVDAGFLAIANVPTSGATTFSINTMLNLSASDYLEVYVAASSGTPTVTVGYPSLSVRRLK